MVVAADHVNVGNALRGCFVAAPTLLLDFIFDIQASRKVLAAELHVLKPAHPRSLVGQDHITLGDYEIHDGMSLELYYN